MCKYSKEIENKNEIECIVTVSPISRIWISCALQPIKLLQIKKKEKECGEKKRNHEKFKQSQKPVQSNNSPIVIPFNGSLRTS